MKSKKSTIPFVFLLLLVVLCLFFPSIPINVGGESSYDAADVAWMLTSTALVLIMTPGLAFFYGGMVKKKNVISTMLQSFICMCLIAVVWVIFGFSLVFGESLYGVIGNPATYFMFNGVIGGPNWSGAPTIPFALFAMYQLKFAIITPALITGAFAERIRFTSYILFVCLFFIFIYAPLAHATWHPEGLLANMGVLDFAGGTVVHMSAGVTAFVSAIFLKRGNSNGHDPARVTYVLIGMGLLWFGWFGFNAGSAFGANDLAASALATTTTASAAAALAWIFFDAARGKKPTAMGVSIGVVVGLVAITPAAGFVTVPHSLIIGVVTSIICNLLVEWRTTRSNVDDTLDVFPSHGVGGMIGMILTGVFATKTINPDIDTNGLFFGETTLFWAQVIGLIGAVAYTFIVAFILLKITNTISKLRVSPEEEEVGLDISQHGEKL
ncbi:ammonium transporter [Olivibacter sp. SDN3]|uniref:ammonium transporter n=1 Tax=Olivibacter sp. SDN3 TaxID=2764720 RepID=UPI0016515FE9|nr:ammonium transporter [Olivibacter sp. SDN3]QNL52497.1 ammonium transporter [Olivibacter sp. SDN3]